MRAIIKKKICDFLDWHLVDKVARGQTEIIFQNIFAQQCLNHGIRNDFYPVGAAARYTLMYLLLRILKENPIEHIIEFGSGQTSLLIERAKSSGCKHVCYEEDAAWHATLSSRLNDCDYRLRPLGKRIIDGIACETYSDVIPGDFDLLLVDGPRGVDEYSRFGAIDLIKANTKSEFIIVFDDYMRPGERQTVQHAFQLLKAKGLDVKLNELHGDASQGVITTPKFRQVSYYF